ncbi:hypothetical protein ACIA5C_37010 [Actinoplanes sp. NPDC051343]|uniref:hypothetical protein n=1 Tax=Actinoplanes sp. NPDC051343 TaxID=3363906 RepID=UPI0037A3A6BA
MAEDVFIPGDDLQQAEDMLNFIDNFIDIDRNQFDFDAAFGPGQLLKSANNFEKKWNDGRTQLKREVGGVKDAVQNILDSFSKTDQDAASNLSDS